MAVTRRILCTLFLTMSLVYVLIVIAPLGLCLCAERPAAFEECAYARTALLVTLLFQLAFDMHQAFLELDVRRMCLSHFLLAHLRGTQRLFEEPKDKRCAPFLAVYAACLVAIARPVRCCPADAGAGAAIRRVCRDHQSRCAAQHYLLCSRGVTEPQRIRVKLARIDLRCAAAAQRTSTHAVGHRTRPCRRSLERVFDSVGAYNVHTACHGCALMAPPLRP